MEVHSDHRADGARKRAQNAIETYALSMYALLGHPSPGGDRIGQMAHEALPLLSPDDLRHPEKPNLAALGQLQQMVLADIGANRPRNMYGAEAARAAQAAGGPDGQRSMGFGYIDALRGSSARYRDLPAGDSVKGSSGQSGSGNPVTAEFARSFAGTGMVGGTLRTFAEVGLDRSTFNAFRKEGFSKEQIKDSAQDTKALGWKGKEDLSIAQHASTRVRKAAVATEQAKTPTQRAERLAREAELEKQNEARPDSDPQKKHDRRFFERRRQDHLRHDAKAGLGTEARQHDAALPSSKDKAGKAERQGQDGLMAKQAAKQTAKVKAAAIAGFEVEPETPAPAKPAPTKVAVVKPAAPAQG